MDMARGRRLFGDMDRPHPQVMRRAQVARVILEHGGRGGVHSVQRKDRIKGRAFGFGQKACVFNAVNLVEQAGQPPRL